MAHEWALGVIMMVLWKCQWSEIVNWILRSVRKTEESKTYNVPIRSWNAMCSSGHSRNSKRNKKNKWLSWKGAGRGISDDPSCERVSLWVNLPRQGLLALEEEYHSGARGNIFYCSSDATWFSWWGNLEGITGQIKEKKSLLSKKYRKYSLVKKVLQP